MRHEFGVELHNKMKDNDKIFLLVGDLGYKMFDDCFKDFPERCINCGAAEQAMLDIACGLALEGKIPFVYSITPFLLYRGFETIRTYINHEKIPVKLIGAGRDKDYLHDGFSHDATDAAEILGSMKNIVQFWPEDKTRIGELIDILIKNESPSFVSLRR